MAYVNDHRISRRRSVKRKRGMFGFGLGGASDCGSNQVWCADYVVPGLPAGQCTTQAQCDAWHVDHPVAQQDAGSSFSDSIGSIAGALSKIFGGAGQQPAAPVVVSSGPSTTTIVALGAAGLAAVYLLTRK